MAQRLQDARDCLARVREKKEERWLLDRAVWDLWTFSEYAVNVVLELTGRSPERHHEHAERAQELRAEGYLKGEYFKALNQLRKFRLKAEHAGYTQAPSVHYSPRNVQDCLDQMELLRAEVENLLRERGRFP